MSYFRHFPFIEDYEIGDRTYLGMNIVIRTGFTDNDMNDSKNYLEYTVKDGETPEILADRLYDNSDYYWIITMFNNIFDISAQWPLTGIALKDFIDRTYGQDQFNIHHYISAATGAIVDSDHPHYDRIPITNREFEIDVNDQKRNIKVPVPDVVDSLRKQHKDKIVK